MKTPPAMAVLSCLMFLASPAMAQHCAPIAESYLSQISVTLDAKQKAIDLKLEYSKSGGRPMEKYQIYVLAYLEKNKKRALSPPPADLINKETVCVLHTQLVSRNKDGRYDCAVQLNMNELAKKIIELGQFAEKDRLGNKDVGHYKDSFRIAVFVPFLEDETYSVLKGLPEVKHECNYLRARALLFQPLPYSFNIFYGYVLGAREAATGEYGILIHADEGEHRIQILADEPPQDGK